MFNKIDAYLITSSENRFYYTGFKSSFGCLILTPNERTLITDMRYASEARKFVKGATILPTTNASYYDDIIKALKKVGAKSIGEHKKLKSELEGFTLKPASSDLDEQRMIKTDEEIAKIQEAQAITQRALNKVMSLIKVGVSEKDLSNEITYQMLKLGADGPAFESIVAFGANTAIPHHHPTGKKLEKNDLITIDIGASVNGYCGDMTRTFCLGKPNAKLAQIHKIVLDAQNYVLKNLKAGMTGREAHLLASEYITANGYGKEFMHGLGHGVGIQVHELPTLAPRYDLPLKENMVVSVEPGIYIDGLGGVRIEDLVVIKENGIVNLNNFIKNLNV